MAEQAPVARELSEQEFNAIRDRLLSEAPDGLSEQDFSRWIGPRFEQALAEAEYGPAKVEGSTLGRAAAGAWEMLNPVEMVKGAYQAVTHPIDTVKGIAGASAEQFGKGVDAIKAGNVAEAAGRFGASFPVVGPVLGAIGDKAGSGDIAGAVGALGGLAAPFAAPFAAGKALKGARAAVPAGTRTAAADVLEQGAQARVVDVMAPKVGPNKTRFGGMAETVAPEVVATLKAEGAPFSREGLQQQLGAKLIEAEQGLDAANDARLAARTFSTRPLIEALMAKRRALTAEAVEGSRLVPAVEGGVSKTPTMDSILGKAKPATEKIARPLGQDVVPGPNANRVAIIDKAIEEIKQLGPVARYEPLRRIRQAYDGPAKAVYSPAVTADYLKAQGGKLGAADVTGALRDALAQMDPATAQANAPYALWRKANDVLEATAEVERTRPTRGRQIAARVLATFGGAQAGGGLGAVMGFALAPLFEATAGVTPKLQTARTMSRLAEAIRRGDLGEVTSLTAQLKASARKATPAAAAGVNQATSPSDSQTPALSRTSP